MKSVIAGIIMAGTLVSAMPASAQRIDIGPGGPSVDMRSRGDRARDDRRDDYRRGEARRDRGMYREQGYDDDRGDRGRRRGYGY